MENPGVCLVCEKQLGAVDVRWKKSITIIGNGFICGWCVQEIIKIVWDKYKESE